MLLLFKLRFKIEKSIIPFLVTIVYMGTFFACNKQAKVTEKVDVNVQTKTIINIVTNNMDFQIQDSIEAGWNTFKYDNRSEETHFFLIDKYPEGKTIEDMEKEVGPVFEKGMDLINEGKQQEGFDAFNELPKWFYEVVFVGGSGLLSPKQSSITTLQLVPGNYIIECYVKMPNGKFHSSMGMVKSLVVTKKVNKNSAPIESVKIKLSSSNGIILQDSIKSGRQVFMIEFEDQKVYENFVGHDINLVMISDHSDLNQLEAWMNWADPKGLVTPAPEGFTFLGGVNDLPAGSKGYFEVDLLPGNYAFISEVPSAREKNLLMTFTIAE
ncbi:hypothetical protein QWY87_05200 [Lutimonas halocynthiae]|uniref:hypothetical protein n=1 Tax=Lutimonas halocynthiae TaxID=1446477 RepID=UPI0025B47111|nr:hypothetical protein [Lutimonas halocynthiae]MDN3642086.1 hypothetical protein [Lutimonas halocynthiae]